MKAFELDSHDLSTGALAILRSTIKHARTNRSTGVHSVPLHDIYAIAGISSLTPSAELKRLLQELKHATFFSHDLGAGNLDASLIFQNIAVVGPDLEFSLSPDAIDASEPREAANDRHMSQLNLALKIALESAEGDAQAFAFYLCAGLAAFQGQRMLNSTVAMESIRLLHQLHPRISV